MAKRRIIEQVAEAMATRRAAEKRQREERGRRAAAGKADGPVRLAQPVSPFIAQHGDYETHMRHTVNRGGTPIARWKKAGLLSESQEAAIQHCVRLWELTSSTGRLVANLDRTVFGSTGNGHSAEIEARDDLHRIKGGFPDAYWNVFENVCRFDEPAGVAGSRLAEDDVTRRTMARTIVCMVADMIYMRERLSY